MKSANCVRLLLLAAFLVVPSLLGAQEMRLVTGSVTDASNMRTLPGVQVSVKGMTVGTLTDSEGSFSFRVPNDAVTLVFTYLGYRTVEAEISGQMNIQLEEQAIGLEGIVVTALGVQREKRSLGYSVQDVSGTDLTEVPEVNLVNSLQGQIAGVQITNAGPTGGSSRIVIRGASSISGNNQPLFIVDGVPVDNSGIDNAGYGGIDYGNLVQDIDPSNIESISVLKGPNAAALYGSRAANGAVVITTKSGRTSRGFSFSTSFTAHNPQKLPD